MSSTSKRPNIILMVADDHGRETLGCYGNKVVKTPNLDSMAENGVIFSNSFCTSASCAASRSVILTGLHNHTNGTYGHTHGKHHFSCFNDVKTLPMFLNKAGYRTGRVGKQHYAPVEQFPFHWQRPAAEFERDDVRKAESCRDFISQDGEFFLYWCSQNPHRAGVKESHPLKPNSFGNPEEDYPEDKECIYSEDEVEIPAFLNDNAESRAEIAQYYQAISRLDRGIGRILQILRDTGKLENTVLIYISDNGAAFPQAKTTLYDPGMRLPCVVQSPFHKKGATCNGLITWADITPTVLDFAGAMPDDHEFFGDSFMRILDEENPADWREEIYASHTFHEITNYYPMRVVRTRKHKFIWNIAWKLDYSFASDMWSCITWQKQLEDKSENFGFRKAEDYVHRPRFELYDIEEDPDEVNNLAEKPEYAEMVEAFCKKVKEFQQETGDPWIHKWIYE